MFDFGFLPKGIILKKLIWLKASGIVGAAYQTFTGTIARFLSPSSKPVKSIVCNIEPVQDLNGYDNPWPAGGGKNKLPNTANTETKNNVKFTVQSDTSIKVENTANANTAFVVGSTELAAGTYILSGITGGVDNDFYVQVVNEAQTSQIAFSYNGDKQFTLAEATTVVYRIFVRNGVNTNGKVIYPMIRLSSISDATFAPYSNICPITGHTGVNVYGTGKNLLDDAFSALYTNTVYLPVGTYYLQAFVTENPSQHTTKPQVYVNGSWENVTPPYSADDGAISITGNDFGWLWSNATQTITITKGGYYIRCNRNDSAMQTRRLSLSTEQLTDFAPFVGTTLPVSWQSEAGTVYAGYCSIDKDGNVTLTATYAEVDMGTLSWAAGYGAYFSTELVSSMKPARNNEPYPMLCDTYAVTAYNAAGDKTVCVIQGNNYLRVNDSDYSTAAALKAALDGVYLVYELATPVTYTLSSVTVPSTVQGENNWWHDANGEITIEAIGSPISSDEPDALQNRLADLIEHYVRVYQPETNS